MTTGGSDHYYLTDALGSVANVTSSTGANEWSYTYEPFGTLRSSTSGRQAPTNLIRFTGQLFDATTGYYDLRAREYDPTNGRFLQLDPLAQPLRKPAMSPYIYANDRPTVLTDPSGMGAEAGESGFSHFVSDAFGCLTGAAVVYAHFPLEVATPWTLGGGLLVGCGLGIWETEAMR